MLRRIFKRRKVEEEPASRITTDTIGEHRENVLAQGRKFKYPLQYVKYKLVINTILISITAIIIVILFSWFYLYKFQGSGNIVYRVTRFIPLPVASIDGQKVLYSDYLMRYRSDIAYINHWEGKLGSDDDSKRKMTYYKREAMNYAQVSSYAIKLANEYGIVIDESRIDEVYNEHRLYQGTEISENSYNRMINESYGLSKVEYKRMIEIMLIRQEVQARIDETAKATTEELSAKLKRDGSNFESVAEEYAGRIITESSGEPVSITNIDGGRAAVANKLESGTISEPFLARNGSGYYFVKLVSRSEGKVEYLSISVPFTELESRVEYLRAECKIREYIKIDDQSSAACKK